MLRKISLTIAVITSAFSVPAQATNYVTLDLTSKVNEGFNAGGWFYHGSDFVTALVNQTTNGNHGSSVPFYVAQSGSNNFWFGLSDGTQSGLHGPLGTLSLSVGTPAVEHVYTLVANTFGTSNALEFTMTLTGTGGSFTQDYIGYSNTADYNRCCLANTWFDNGVGQGLYIVDTPVPVGFHLQSIRIDQVDGQDGAIVAGVTLATEAPLPEPASWALMISGFGIVGQSLRGRRRVAQSAT